LGERFEAISAELGEGGIATVTLNRPEKRNALSIRLRDELDALLSDWRDDPEVRVVVLTGAGKAFCAGFDLDQFAEAGRARGIYRSSARYHRSVWSFPKPIVCAVNGAAMGGGFDLALLCDLRIASREASFGHPEIKFGAPPLFTPLRWTVGDGIARDLCLTGRRVDATEAMRIGLVSRVVEPGELASEARATAASIVEAPQHALEAAKRYLTGSWGLGFEDSLRLEHDDVFERLLTGPVGPAGEADS
jgi:enoyl-CoA hydratase/carnithine racemase